MAALVSGCTSSRTRIPSPVTTRALPASAPGAAPGRSRRRVGMGPQHLEALPACGGEGTGLGVAGPHHPSQFGGGTAPVQLELLCFELVGVGGFALLDHSFHLGDLRQVLDQQLGAEFGQAGAQFAGRLLLADGDRLPHVHGTGVEPLLQQHEAHAGLVVAGEHGPLHRRRAAPAGQQGEVGVDEPLRHDVQHRLRDQLPEGDDDGDLRPAGGDVAQGLLALLGGDDGQAQFERTAFDWTRVGARPPAAAPVGLGDDQDDLVPGGVRVRTGRGKRLDGASREATFTGGLSVSSRSRASPAWPPGEVPALRTVEEQQAVEVVGLGGEGRPGPTGHRRPPG